MDLKRKSTRTVTVILPTYNEAGNITRLIREIHRRTKRLNWQLKIHVVDDNSPDGTGVQVRRVFKDDTGVRVTIRKKERGLATALLYGIKHAKTRYILLMDSDFNHHPQYIPEMLKRVKEMPNLVVSGSRYISGGGMDEKERFIGSQFINDAMKLVLGMPITDYLSGFILIQRKLLLKLPSPWIFRGFGEWALRLHYLLYKKDVAVREIPVFYPARPYGTTKIRPLRYALTLVRTVTELKFQTTAI